MFHMFYGAYAFNQDLSQWDTSRVTSMNSMFCEAAAFDQDLSDWNTSRVINMGLMFVYATAFNEDLSQWDISSVKDMSNMFEGAVTFNQNLCAWKQNFPFQLGTNIFSDSGCTYKDTPINNSSTFCAAGHDCAVQNKSPLFDQLFRRSISSTCSMKNSPSLMCSASTDATVDGGIFKTYLVVGGCSAQNGDSVEGKKVSGSC